MAPDLRIALFSRVVFTVTALPAGVHPGIGVKRSRTGFTEIEKGKEDGDVDQMVRCGHFVPVAWVCRAGFGFRG
ncbi:MAG: hypothetical protein Q8N48_06300 [Thiobacillus sp.]|nr:hypothetical protein [Thiobacillus sp.]